MKNLKFKEIANVVSGGSAPKEHEFSDEGIPFIRVSNLDFLMDGGNENILPKLNKEVAENKKLKLIPKGTIVFAKSGMSCLQNRVYILKHDAYIVNHLAGVIFKEMDIAMYIKYWLDYFKPSSLVVNEAYPSIRLSDIKNITIKLPPLQTQQKIVEVLDKAQELIDLRKKQIEMLDELIQSIFYDMFGDPVVNPRGWDVKKLKECGKINPRKSEVSNMSDIQVSFVPMSNVSEKGDLDLSERRNIDEVYKSYTYFKDGDVLFAKITPCMENGKGCIASNLLNGIGFGSTEFHVIRPDQSIVNSSFIYYLTMTENFRMAAERKMTGSAGQKRVPTVYLKNYNLIIPPIKLQNQFAQKVQKIEAQKELMQESLTEMQNNFNSLMQRAFKGELFN